METDDKNLAYQDLRGKDFSNLDLTGANLEGANLSGVNLKDARLSRANLKGANLEASNLSTAILQSADFRQTNLRNALLVGVYAMWTDFRGADLSNTNFKDAILDAARFEDAQLADIKLAGVRYNRATSWPSDFKPHRVIPIPSPQEVRTVNDLVNFLWALSSSQAIDYGDSLEKYLCRLWNTVETHRNESMTPTLLAQLFAESFLEGSIDLPENWSSFASVELPDKIGDDYEYLRRIVSAQIADLHLAHTYGNQENYLKDWSNLLLEDYLEAAGGGFYAHCQNYSDEIQESENPYRKIGRHLKSQECTWRDLADILELGKVYE